MARNRLNEPTGAFAVRAPPGRESRALKCVPRAALMELSPNLLFTADEVIE
jgi:hypothetical protein